MKVARRWKLQRLLQSDLPGGGVEQVSATHDIGYPLRSVIDYHRKLVRIQSIGAFEHDIAHGVDGGGLLQPEASIHKFGSGFGRAKAQGWPRAARMGHAREMRAAGRGKISSTAATFEQQAALPQRCECRVVRLAALTLPHDRFVRFQTKPLQRLQLTVGCACALARWVDVFDAYQPRTRVMSRVQPAAERGDQRAKMQWPGGRRGEASAIPAQGVDGSAVRPRKSRHSRVMPITEAGTTTKLTIGTNEQPNDASPNPTTFQRALRSRASCSRSVSF